MPAPNLLVVSDVHLCRLRPRMFEGGQRHLATFIERAAVAPPPSGPWRLLLAGDVLDFDHQARSIEERRDEAGARALFAGIALAHPEFFDALGRFLAAGHEVVVLPGNHDLDLLWPGVRADFVERLRPTAGEGLERLSFRDWYYYEPGRVFVEHGQAYDPDTAVFGALHPFDEHGDGLEMRRNLGTWWIAEFCPHITELAYHVDHTRSALYYLPAVAKRLSWRAPLLWGRYLAFVARAIADAGRRRRAVPAAHEARLGELAREPGLDLARLRRIESFFATPCIGSRLATAARFHAAPAALIPVVLGLGVAAAALASTPLAIAAASLALPLVALNVLVSSRFHSRVPAALREAGAKVQAALDVPIVVMGHCHEAADVVVGTGRYLNSGTWSDPKAPLSYVRIVGERAELASFTAMAEPQIATDGAKEHAPGAHGALAID